MAHTCSACGVHLKCITAPTATGYEQVRNTRLVGSTRAGSHNIHSWKRAKVRKQWMRHRRDR